MSKWIYRQQNSFSGRDSGGVPVSILGMLENRGITEPEEIEDFLSASPRLTYDPALLKDLEPAVDLILDYCSRGEKICVYGDYDADGVTSTALLLCVLKKLSSDVDFYVPSRFTDGYGLTNNAIERIAAKGTKLIVTVDCGSTSEKEVAFAKSLGLEVIVTDHHTIDEDHVPDCLFVNPRREDSQYPFRGLSGCGVAFKMAQLIQRRLAERGDCRFTKNDMNSLLDLVAISTIADVVPLLDENRTLIKHGLRIMAQGRRPGLKYLFEALNIQDKPITSDTIGFIIAPHINSLGRIGSAESGVRLLESSGSEKELRALAAEMLEANKKRRDLQEATKAVCEAELKKGNSGELFPIICAPGAHEGVAGIVAGNYKEKLNRPVCIVTPTEKGVLKGTGRCITGVNLHEILSCCSDVFLRFGGHAGACGFSLEEAKLDELRKRTDELMKRLLSKDPELLEEKIIIEKILEPEEKNLDFARRLSMLEPFGEANPKPLFSVNNCELRRVARMGAENQHVRFSAVSSDGIEVPCVLFKRADDYCDLLTGWYTVDVCGELGINEYNGNQKLQLTVKDIRRSEV